MSGPEGPTGGARPDLEPDVERIHRLLYREPRDPEEGREPVPWWVWAATVAAIFWGGFYLGRFGGSFGTATHEAYARPEPAVAREVREQATLRATDAVAHGREVYGNVCQACHQAEGRGLAGVFPPLRGSRWVTGDEERLVRILLHGLQGPIEVMGTTYSGVMPGWGDQLDDEAIAAVATYVRQWDPNDAPAVEPDAVRRVREATAGRTAAWTADELAEDAS